MRKNYNQILGVTDNGNFIFVNVDVRFSDDEGLRFSANFDEVRPVELTRDFIRSRTRSLIESMPEQSLSMLDLLGISLDEAVDKFINRLNFSIEDIIDISLHSTFYFIDGVENDIVMESLGCGQLDVDKMDIDYFYPSMAKFIIKMWKDNHLDNISAHQEKRLRSYFNKAQKLNPEDWITNKIKSVIGN